MTIYKSTLYYQVGIIGIFNDNRTIYIFNQNCPFKKIILPNYYRFNIIYGPMVF